MTKFIVRYGAMRNLGLMGSRNERGYERGVEVIARTNRGLEVGQVLSEAADDALSHLDNAPSGQIVREVSEDDAIAIARIDESRDEKLEICQNHISSLKLEMKLVELEQLFGGERLVIYYLADERVDFRQLVKNLGSEFQTRIEMKQIGVRDEAKLLADYGDCGKPVCCANHLAVMPPVSMKMAKLQKATLDPTKISGRCGRLKCCLRYEYDHYEAVEKKLPKVGAHILTREGRMRVVSQEILLEQLLVETEEGRRIIIDASEVLSIIKPGEGDRRKRKGRKPQKSAKGTKETPKNDR